MKKLLFALCVCFSISVEASILYSDEDVQISGKCQNNEPTGTIVITEKNKRYPNSTLTIPFKNGMVDTQKNTRLDFGQGNYTLFYFKPTENFHYGIRYVIYKTEDFNSEYSKTQPWKTFTYGEKQGIKVSLTGIIKGKKLTAKELEWEFPEDSALTSETRINNKIKLAKDVCQGKVY